MTKVRRCQAWVITDRGSPSDWTDPMVEQCDEPAEYDGVHCEEHKDQKPEWWMKKP